MALPFVKPSMLVNSVQVTDVYLLSLAVSRQGFLATFDQRINSQVVWGGDEALVVIDA